MLSIAVAGAGQCGLEVATSLARSAVMVTVIERLPVAGGQVPEGRDTDALVKRAEQAGVHLVLGTLAVSWDGQVVRALGDQGAVTIASSALVVATGTRPATLTEMGVAGDRTAGIVPGSAALHLLESGVLLGWRPTILGGGALAASCLESFRHAGVSHVTVVAPSGCTDHRLISASSRFDGWRVTRVSGTPRVSSLEVARDEVRERIATDAVILCEGRIAMRNIEGAVFTGSNVVYCQSLVDPKSFADVQAVAARAQAELGELASSQRTGDKEMIR